MNTSAIVSFIQGMFYPFAMFVLSYIINNLGASGIFSVSTATIITGFLSVLEDYLQKKGKGALFGMARR